MKRNKVLLIALLINVFNSYSCTTFVLKHGSELIFGRNLDWVSDNGIIVENMRNVTKRSLVFTPDKSIEWTSKFGSITFNQFGKEFPFGGINEKGLVVEIMVAKADYPLFDSRPAINELQWIQYQLDNSKSIEDVINSDKILRIRKMSKELHFMICDNTGNVAVIEFRNSQMLVYRGKDLPYPVLENDVYSKSLYRYKNNESCRFATATKMISNYKPQANTSIIDYSFDILKSVVLKGSWSIVYDIKNMKIYFKTASNPNIQTIDFKKFDFNCEFPGMVYNLELNGKGNINDSFIPFNSELNENKMQSAVRSNSLKFPNNILLEFKEYYKTCKCSK